MHGHFYGNFTGNLAHAQSVCTRPFSRGEGPGDEASLEHKQGCSKRSLKSSSITSSQPLQSFVLCNHLHVLLLQGMFCQRQDLVPVVKVFGLLSRGTKHRLK